MPPLGDSAEISFVANQTNQIGIEGKRMGEKKQKKLKNKSVKYDLCKIDLSVDKLMNSIKYISMVCSMGDKSPRKIPTNFHQNFCEMSIFGEMRILGGLGHKKTSFMNHDLNIKYYWITKRYAIFSMDLANVKIGTGF